MTFEFKNSIILIRSSTDNLQLAYDILNLSPKQKEFVKREIDHLTLKTNAIVNWVHILKRIGRPRMAGKLESRLRIIERQQELICNGVYFLDPHYVRTELIETIDDYSNFVRRHAH